jgi:membrane-associated phospholipid phosphatase
MIQFLDFVGFEGPNIMFVMTFLSVLTQYKFCLAFPIGWFLNSKLNKFLKNWIREPRPTSLHNLGSLDNIKDYHGAEVYGMPSGHSQSMFFSLFYLYLVKKSNVLLWITLFLAGLTLYQRWIYGRHTTEQLLVGSCIGVGFATLWFRLVQAVEIRRFAIF